jgi:hypothetical protein
VGPPRHEVAEQLIGAVDQVTARGRRG